MDTQVQPIQANQPDPREQSSLELITELHGVLQNFSDSIEIYRQGFSRFFSTSLISSVVVLLTVFILNSIVLQKFIANDPTVISVILYLLFFIGICWVCNSVMSAALNNTDEFEVVTCLQMGQSEIISTILSSILIIFSTAGVLFLVLAPPLIFDNFFGTKVALVALPIDLIIIFFGFSWWLLTTFVILDEHETDLDAMLKSLAYSRNIRIGVVWRFFVITACAGTLIFLATLPTSFISNIIQNTLIIILIIFFLPLIVNYYFLTYSDLKHIKTNNNELFLGHKVYLIGFSFIGFITTVSLGIISINDPGSFDNTYKYYSGKKDNSISIQNNSDVSSDNTQTPPATNNIAPPEPIMEIEDNSFVDTSRLSKNTLLGKVAEAVEGYNTINGFYPKAIKDLTSEYVSSAYLEGQIYEYAASDNGYWLCLQDNVIHYLCKRKPIVAFNNEIFLSQTNNGDINTVLKSITTALENFRKDKNFYPNAIEGLIPGYLDKIPPFTYSNQVFQYGVRDNNADYRICMTTSASDINCYSNNPANNQTSPANNQTSTNTTTTPTSNQAVDSSQQVTISNSSTTDNNLPTKSENPAVVNQAPTTNLDNNNLNQPQKINDSSTSNN